MTPVIITSRLQYPNIRVTLYYPPAPPTDLCVCVFKAPRSRSWSRFALVTPRFTSRGHGSWFCAGDQHPPPAPPSWFLVSGWVGSSRTPLMLDGFSWVQGGTLVRRRGGGRGGGGRVRTGYGGLRPRQPASSGLKGMGVERRVERWGEVGEPSRRAGGRCHRPSSRGGSGRVAW